MSFAIDDTKFVRESHLVMKERKLAKAFRIQKNVCIYIYIQMKQEETKQFFRNLTWTLPLPRPLGSCGLFLFGVPDWCTFHFLNLFDVFWFSLDIVSSPK